MVVAAMCGNSVFLTSSPASIAIRDVMPLCSASSKRFRFLLSKSKRGLPYGRRAHGGVWSERCVGKGRTCSIKFTSQTPLATGQQMRRKPRDGDCRPGSSPGLGSGSLCDVCRRCALQKGFRQA